MLHSGNIPDVRIHLGFALILMSLNISKLMLEIDHMQDNRNNTGRRVYFEVLLGMSIFLIENLSYLRDSVDLSIFNQANSNLWRYLVIRMGDNTSLHIRHRLFTVRGEITNEPQ